VNEYAERVNSYAEHYNDVKSDKAKLLEIYEEDEKLGQMFLKKMFDGKSIDEFKSELEKESADPSKIDSLVEQKLEQKEVEKLLEKVKNQLPEELVSKFEEEYADLVDGKTINSKNAGKYIKHALREVQ
jgi:hypothetical protein